MLSATSPSIEVKGIFQPALEDPNVRIAQRIIAKCKEENNELLDLSNLGLNEIPEEAWELSHIQNLDIHGNHLNELPPEIVKLCNLKYLHINRNYISDLPDSIEGLHHLAAIYASDNAFTSLRSFVKLKSSLAHLSIENNIEGRSKETALLSYTGEVRRLSSLDGIGELKELGYLCADENDLSTLPEVMGSLEKLLFLYLKENKFTSRPTVLEALEKRCLELEIDIIEADIEEDIDEVLQSKEQDKNEMVHQWVNAQHIA